MHILEQSAIRVLNASGATVGTGFVVGDHLAVTCAHVVQQASSSCGQTLSIQFYQNGERQEVLVLNAGWSSPSGDDVAFLQLASLPQDVLPVVLGSAHSSRGHSSYVFGFASLAAYESRPVSDTLDGVADVRDQRKQPMLQLKGEEVDRGLSGSPVLDTEIDRVVGMVSEYIDRKERTRLAWATTADTLLTLAKKDVSLTHASLLQLWPPTYGPAERTSYLQYLIATCQRVELPNGQAVELERIYVSLRAAEMNPTEWKAEHELYLDEVEQLTQALRAAHVSTDTYTMSNVLRRAIVRHPQVLKLTARDWHKLFTSQRERSLSLADVVSRHSHVVILGDPGSGKSTIGKWLALQHARALLQRHPRVQVRAQLVDGGTEAEAMLDLGEARWPILVRVADYAQTRWPNGPNDTYLPLERFLGQQEHRLDRPTNLIATAMQAMAWEALAHGQALVILDGLDEVTNHEQRKKVMLEVRRFLPDPTPAISLATTSEQWSKNMVLLTSRIVGYQFDPLIDLPHYTIEDMDEPAITALCRAWMRHVATLNDAEADEETRRFTDLLFHHAHAGVRALGGNPLLSTLLVQVYWTSPERTLPSSRVALFEEVSRLMYDLREQYWDQVGIPLVRLHRALGAVAHYIHASEPTGFTDQGQIVKCLQRVLGNPEHVEAVLVAAREASGFLIARGEGVYGFLHRSLQEYFVALYLTDPYEDETLRHLIERLVSLSLDPAWRESVVLAVGMVSRSKHPGNRQLGTLFSALLDAPDPADIVLPRREFLVVAACAECQRPPVGIGKRVAEHLLAQSVTRGEHAISMVIYERIREAFRTLQRCPPPVTAETETVLCAAIQDPDFERRYAAIDLIMTLRWDTSAIASALVTAWKIYAGPAGSMLLALEGIAKRNPAYFMSLGLQTGAALVWEQVEASAEWRAMVHVLYLPAQAETCADQVNRDSPLTELLVAALRQNEREDVLELLHHQLGALAVHPGSAQARDAALVLATLGDTHWVQACVAQAGTQDELLRPLFAALQFFLTRYRARARALALALALTHDRARALALALDLIRGRIQEFEQALQTARVRWRDNPLIGPTLDRALELFHVFKHFSGLLQPLATLWKALIDTYEKHHSALMLQPQQMPTNQQGEVTPDMLKQLPEDLTCLDDKRRERAREFLAQQRPASLLGRACIEQMAVLAQKHASDPQTGMHLEWALHRIMHNMPEWIDRWIAQAQDAEQKTLASTLLESIHTATPEVFERLLQVLPEASVKAKEAILNSLDWMIRLKQIPEQCHSSLLEQLMCWLEEEYVPVVRLAIITALGHWQDQDTAGDVGEILLRLLKRSTAVPQQEREILSTSLARLATHQPALIEEVQAVFTSNGTRDVAAFVRLSVALVAPGTAEHLLMRIRPIIANPSACLKALLQAGTDDDLWDDDYHSLLARAIQGYLKEMPDLLPLLLTALSQALAQQDWPRRRIALAAVAACAEEMPTTLQQTAHRSLEVLLIQGAIDAESYTSRRFALTGLSYLRTLTPAMVPALLAGCQDIEIVQRDAIAVASRFQEIQGDVLSELVPWLTGESVSTAYGVAQVLGALGTSMAGSAAQLHRPIIEALGQAIKHPGNQRKVIIAGDEKGTLEDALYSVLLGVVGWLA